MALTGAQYMSIRTKFLGLMGSPYQGVSSAELDSFLGQLIGEVTGTVTATQKNNADSMLAGYLTSPAYTATAANIAEFFTAAVAALPVITTALTAPRYLQLKQQFTGVLSYAGIRTAAEMLAYMAGYLLPVDLSVFFTPGTVLQTVQSDLRRHDGRNVHVVRSERQRQALHAINRGQAAIPHSRAERLPGRALHARPRHSGEF
jgi:hypothetical protein